MFLVCACGCTHTRGAEEEDAMRPIPEAQVSAVPSEGMSLKAAGPNQHFFKERCHPDEDASKSRPARPQIEVGLTAPYELGSSASEDPVPYAGYRCN